MLGYIENRCILRALPSSCEGSEAEKGGGAVSPSLLGKGEGLGPMANPLRWLFLQRPNDPSHLLIDLRIQRLGQTIVLIHHSREQRLIQ